MIHIKEYKIFENDNNIRDIIHECFLPVEDLTHVFTYFSNPLRSVVYDSVVIQIYNLNNEICEEVANAVSHCIGMGLYYCGTFLYYKNELNNGPLSDRCFTSSDIEEFYNFITSQKEISKIKIELKYNKL